MKKVAVKLLSLMLAFMVMFGAAGMTASAASKDAKCKSFCKELNKGNKFGKTIGSYKVKYKKQNGKYQFTVTLNTNVGLGNYQMVKAMVPDKYYETRDSFKKTIKKLKKKAKKAGIKKASFTYIIKASGEKLWEFQDDELVYDRFE